MGSMFAFIMSETRLETFKESGKSATAKVVGEGKLPGGGAF